MTAETHARRDPVADTPRIEVERLEGPALHPRTTDGEGVPDEIMAHLPPVGTIFALLDPVRAPNVAARVGNAGLRSRILFRGELAEQKDVAPLLVELPAAHWFTRALFTHNEPARPRDMWLTAPLLIQATSGIDVLHAHLRRFLRAKSETDGKLWFFRFWEPRTAPAYFANLSDRPDLVTRWFKPRGGGDISRMMIADVHAGTTPAIWLIRPHGLPPTPAGPRGVFYLSESDLAVMTHVRQNQDLSGLSRLLLETFPNQAATEPNLQRFTERTVSRMRDYGFSQRDFLFQLLSWELFLGSYFETSLRDGALGVICKSDLPEEDKFRALTALITADG